jgi:hypothetical protein
MNLTPYVVLLGYFALFLLSCTAMLWWSKRQRHARLPFAKDIKLLRIPGETQLKHVLKFEEDLTMWLLLASGAPWLVAGLFLFTVKQLPAGGQPVWLLIGLVGFIAAFIVAARWLTRRLTESRNRYLGYFGERVVAEHLEPLKQQGWRVFHDVPCASNGASFNIDHVAVGPQGVFVIETKTRRKGSARPGFDDHKVYFDGRSLVWPWGEDNHGLEQAENNAVWLARTLKDETSERVHVSAVLTLPGWWVENKPARESRICRVTNPKSLPKFLGSGPVALSPKQFESIVAKLDTRCRDVAFD